MRSSNADMGGKDFGMRDSSSWDDNDSLICSLLAVV